MWLSGQLQSFQCGVHTAIEENTCCRVRFPSLQLVYTHVNTERRATNSLSGNSPDTLFLPL